MVQRSLFVDGHHTIVNNDCTQDLVWFGQATSLSLIKSTEANSIRLNTPSARYNGRGHCWWSKEYA